MYYVYILFSENIKRFYTGSTSMLPHLRLAKHLSDHKGFTAKAKDWKIVFIEPYDDKKQATVREKQIKSWKSSVAIRRLIDGSEHPD